MEDIAYFIWESGFAQYQEYIKHENTNFDYAWRCYQRAENLHSLASFICKYCQYSYATHYAELEHQQWELENPNWEDDYAHGLYR